MPEVEVIFLAQSLAEQIEKSHFRLTDAAHHKWEKGAWRTDWHKHSGIELLYLLIRGGASIETSGQKIGALGCTVIAYPANVYHEEKMDHSRSQEFYCLMLETDFVLPSLLHIPDRDGKLLWLFSNIHSEFCEKQRNEALLSHYIKALLHGLIQMKPEALPAGEVIERYIRANYRERISVQDAAMAACVSESYACRVLKRRLGLSPIQLINNLRLEEARRLLIATDSAVEQVSQEAGFASSKYFSRIFREKFGCTPSRFRKSEGKTT